MYGITSKVAPRGCKVTKKNIFCAYKVAYTSLPLVAGDTRYNIPKVG